jgi:hypothetical protein
MHGVNIKAKTQLITTLKEKQFLYVIKEFVLSVGQPKYNIH